ncbi:putative UDP-N-acetylglucosamine--peptide N-acetylglucosaminyltransferase [Paratrimastix pyriformis]|uniref:protein O-GlcNAc transferase n=1 Tax=Paratrimastix pyriformis TaxID=342808 RepID=A0ABQ8UMS5_9EUKA|nr:putative UDP-N-acetylglucosamine--peptide N-acetylglucosaminyltransferase [Paratrimastix pyriformis]
MEAHLVLGRQFVEEGRLGDATEEFKQALQYNPRSIEIMNFLGNTAKLDGRLDESEMWYRSALKISPNFAVAWSNLAGVMKAKGRLNDAVEMYLRAINLSPQFADAHSNLGNVYKELNMPDQALISYDNAIKARPTFAAPYSNKATVYHDAGDYERALPLYRKAIELDPRFLDAYNNLGNALKSMGRLDEAIAAYQNALQFQPTNAHILNNLGNALKEKGQTKEALTAYQTALKAQPNFPPVLNNLASLLKELGRAQEAMAMYRRAIEIDPKFADAYSNLGNALKDIGHTQDAIWHYQHAIELKPRFADAHSNLASVYKDTNCLKDAIAFYQKALEIKPDFPDAFANLVHCLQMVCDWRDRDAVFARLSRIIHDELQAGRTPAVQPFHALVYPIDSHLVIKIAAHYAEKARQHISYLEPQLRSFPFAAPQLPPRPPAPRRTCTTMAVPEPWAPRRCRAPPDARGLRQQRLGTTRSHLMQSVFGMHNRRFFKEWRAKIEREVENFVDISALSNEDAARRIHGDRVDVLINLNGYTKGARTEIFALRPAPLQVSYMGYASTMGADFMDYYITDSYVSPPGLAWTFTEKLILMPDSYFVNDHRQVVGSIHDETNRALLPKRSSMGGDADPDGRGTWGMGQLPDDRLVLCNFNQLYKNDPVGLTMWCNILKRVPDAVLWLLRFPPEGEANIRAEMHAQGISDERIIFGQLAKKDVHLRRCHLADLFLDTTPYNGHTTGTDALWGGLPYITLPGIKMVSRVATGLANALGCPEMVVNSGKEYEDLAVAWCNNQARHAFSQPPPSTCLGSKGTHSCRPVGPNGFHVPTYIPPDAGLPDWARPGDPAKKATSPSPPRPTITTANRASFSLQDIRGKCLERGLWRAWQIHCGGEAPRHIDVRAECELPPVDLSHIVTPTQERPS